MDSHQPDASGFKNSDEFEQLTLPPSRLNDPGDESISDEENDTVSNFAIPSGAVESPRSYNRNFEREDNDETGSWSAILEEAEGLVCAQKKTSTSFISGVPQARNIRRGGRGNNKLKFSIRFQSQKEEHPWSCSVNSGHKRSFGGAAEDLAGLEHIPVENSMADLLGNLQEEIDEFPTELVSLEQRPVIPSVAELLEDLQEKNVPYKGSSNLLKKNAKAKERKTQFSGKRMLVSLGTRVLDSEDPLEFMVDGISSEDEAVDKNNLNIGVKNIKGHTMTDLLHEAFSISNVEEPLLPTSKQARTGYHRRLQQVLQDEKDRHLEFSKMLQTRCSPYNESGCIDVRILSRYLEAKLTVCCCLFGENIKNFQVEKPPQVCADDEGAMERTIIFSSRICDNVELEVGNLIHIHPPWKEVQANKDEKIILCMYFSQIMI